MLSRSTVLHVGLIGLQTVFFRNQMPTWSSVASYFQPPAAAPVALVPVKSLPTCSVTASQQIYVDTCVSYADAIAQDALAASTAAKLAAMLPLPDLPLGLYSVVYTALSSKPYLPPFWSF